MKRILMVITLLLVFSLTFEFSGAVPEEVTAQTDYQVFLPMVVEFHIDMTYSVVGPDGGTVECIAVDPQDSNIIYAGSWGNGFYKSTDGGSTWVNKSEGLEAAFILEIVVDPTDSDHILVSSYRYGAFQSFDGGETWSSTVGWYSGSVVYDIEFDPTDPSIVYAAIRLPTVYNPPAPPSYPGKVFKSTDGGTTWWEKSSGLTNDYIYDLAIDPNDTDVIYAAMHTRGVFMTEDGGNHWEPRLENLVGYDIRAVTVRPEDSAVFIGQWDGQGISYSPSGAPHWYKISSTVDDKLYVYELQFDPNHPTTLYASTTNGLYICERPFYASECTLVAHPGKFVYDLELDVNGPVDSTTGKTKHMYTSLSYDGLFKSTNAGQSFQLSNTGIKANVVVSILSDPADPATLYISSYGNGLWKSTDYGENWISINTGLPTKFINTLYFRPGNSNVIFAGTQNKGLYRSDNAGVSWVESNSGLDVGSIRGAYAGEEKIALPEFQNERAVSWMDPVDLEALKVLREDYDANRAPMENLTVLTLSADPNNPDWMVMGTDGDGIKRSFNGGEGWFRTFYWDNVVYDSFVDPTQPTYYFFTGLYNLGMLTSDWERNQWFYRSDGLFGGTDIYALTMASSGVYYAGTEYGVFKTVNAGVSWQYAGLNSLDITDVYVDPGSPNVVWAATSANLYRSGDAGGSWTKWDFGYFNDYFLTITPGDGTYPMYFGMSGGNVYRIDP